MANICYVCGSENQFVDVKYMVETNVCTECVEYDTPESYDMYSDVHSIDNMQNPYIVSNRYNYEEYYDKIDKVEESKEIYEVGENCARIIACMRDNIWYNDHLIDFVLEENKKKSIGKRCADAVTNAIKNDNSDEMFIKLLIEANSQKDFAWEKLKN